MGGGVTGRGPAGAGPAPAGRAGAGPAGAGPPGAGFLSTWPGIGARRSGIIAPGPVRAASGLAGRAEPAVLAGLGPVQPGAVRPVPGRGAGATRSDPART